MLVVLFSLNVIFSFYLRERINNTLYHKMNLKLLYLIYTSLITLLLLLANYICIWIITKIKIKLLFLAISIGTYYWILSYCIIIRTTQNKEVKLPTKYKFSLTFPTNGIS